MYRQSVVTLIAEQPQAHGVFDGPVETERTVFCTIRSVGYSEFYRAREHDLFPTLVFVLRDYAEYQGEKTLVYEGKRYHIIRTYINPQNEIELTVEEESNG